MHVERIDENNTMQALHKQVKILKALKAEVACAERIMARDAINGLSDHNLALLIGLHPVLDAAIRKYRPQVMENFPRVTLSVEGCLNRMSSILRETV